MATDAKLLYGSTSFVEEDKDAIYITDDKGKWLNPHVKPNAIEITEGNTLTDILESVVTGLEGRELKDYDDDEKGVFYLENAQKNIHALSYDERTYSAEQQAQARKNIGATSEDDVLALIDELKNVDVSDFITATAVQGLIATAKAELKDLISANASAISAIKEYLGFPEGKVEDEIEEKGTVADQITLLEGTIDDHIGNTDGNPHVITREKIGLGKVNNNSIAMKRNDAVLNIYFDYTSQEEGGEV